MKILHIDPDDMDNPLSGGGPVRTFEICRRLARRHEITVLTPTFPGSTPEKEREGIRYVRLGRKIRDHGSSHHITFLASLPQAVRRFEYDLLVEDFMPPCSATWTPWFRRRDKPLIASVQWFFAHEYTRRLKLPFHWGQDLGVRWYDRFVVLTDDMKRTIEARNPGADCRVLPNGVPDDLFEIEPHVGDFMLYLGRIEVHAKGLDLLLQAMANVPEQQRMRLVLAGSGPEQAALEHWIEQTGMRPWVNMVGHVSAAKRAHLLRTCRFMVMPSRIETFGMTIAEAHAAGKCVVVWDIAPMNEVAAPDAVRAASTGQNPEAYAAAMLELIDMPDEALAQRGMACRQWARRYNWDAVAAAQEAFYLQACEA